MQVGQDFGWWYDGVERDRLTKFADPSIFYDCEYKIPGLMFGVNEELLIRNFGPMDVF